MATGNEPISAANLSAVITSAVASAVSQATTSAKAYTDQQVQAIQDEMDDIANTFYSCTVTVTYDRNGSSSPATLTITKERETSNGGVSVSYAKMGTYARATVTTTKAGSYDVSVDGARLGRFYGGPGQSYQFDLVIEITGGSYADGSGTFNVFVERVA